MMKFIITYCSFLLFCVSGFTQTENKMEEKTELVISKKLLNKNISEFSSYFRKIEIIEAKEKKILSKFNYIYSKKDSLYFLGYKIENLSIVVKKDKIYEAFFEIFFNDKKIFQDFIQEYGYPSSGHVNPDLTYPKDSTVNNPANFKYENYTGLTWVDDNDDTTMHITNLLNNNYFIDKKSKLWVSFNVIKKNNEKK